MNKRIFAPALLVVAVAPLASACGDASADDLAALQAESGETITALETDIAARDQTITDLEGELECCRHVRAGCRQHPPDRPSHSPEARPPDQRR